LCWTLMSHAFFMGILLVVSPMIIWTMCSHSRLTCTQVETLCGESWI
jgi:predicted small integral membrane protein